MCADPRDAVTHVTQAIEPACHLPLIDEGGRTIRIELAGRLTSSNTRHCAVRFRRRGPRSWGGMANPVPARGKAGDLETDDARRFKKAPDLGKRQFRRLL